MPTFRRSLRYLARIALPTTLAISVVGHATPASAADPLPSHAFGVRYGNTPALIAEYERWLGKPVDVLTTYFHGPNDAQLLTTAASLIRNFKGSRYRTIVFSLPLVHSGETLTQVANGSKDHMVRELAKLLVAGGRADDVIRPGWELNQPGQPWNALANPAAYAAAFRRVVTVMRSVPGARTLRFEWNFGRGGKPVPLEAYPGDAYVDIIGLDIYDRTYNDRYRDPAVRWQSYLTGNPSLTFARDFARSKGKPIGISEWGLSSKHVPGATPDNTLFVANMVAWVKANNVAYANYFERDSNFLHRLMLHYPRGAATYKAAIR